MDGCISPDQKDFEIYVLAIKFLTLGNALGNCLKVKYSSSMIIYDKPLVHENFLYG